AGSLVCLAATIACAVAPTVLTLGIARFVQGLSGAAGVVLARAIISDTARGALAAKLLGIVTVISVIAPVVAPVSGGAIIDSLGWRAVFGTLAVLTALMFVGAAIWARESLPHAERTGGGAAATLASARVVLANRNYLGYLLTF